MALCVDFRSFEAWLEQNMASPDVNALRLEDIYEGRTASFQVVVSGKDIDTFAQLTGDVSPLHMDNRFAQSRGFPKRLVHGALLDGFVSKLFGVYLPGCTCLLQSIKSSYVSPAFEGDKIQFEAHIKTISEAARAVIATTRVTNVANGDLLMRGQVQFGFTDEAPFE
jgi:3-hydroxybutyryl-CoA dehydratase